MAILFGQENGEGSVFLVAGALVTIVIGLVIFAIFARYFTLWIQCVTTGAGIHADIYVVPLNQLLRLVNAFAMFLLRRSRVAGVT